MTNRYPATKARVNFGAILDEVANRGNEIVVEKLGKPVARISPYAKSPRDVQWLREKISRYIKRTDSTKAIRLDRDER